MIRVAVQGTLLVFMFLFLHCGGGSDIGNPEIPNKLYDAPYYNGNSTIAGIVSYSNGLAGTDAMVVLGEEGFDAEMMDTTYTEVANGVTFIIKPIGFDTVRCDSRGIFEFTGVQPGKYVLFASSGSTSVGIEKVENPSYMAKNVHISLNRPGSISVYSKTVVSSNDTNVSFVEAGIGGTNYIGKADSLGNITFTSVPAGELNIILHRKNGEVEYVKDFTLYPDASSSLTVDPYRSQDFWVLQECGPRDPLARPYIIWSSPKDKASGDSACVNVDKEYDMVIQFSHPMNTIATTKAVSAFSDDGGTALDTLWWQGADALYISLCIKDSAGVCMDSSSYSKGITYKVRIDTVAQSALGVNFAFPDTLEFTPEP